MKKLAIAAGTLGLLALSYQPAIAKCAPLIKEAREQLGSAKLSKSDDAKVKALLKDADKLTEANNHIDAVKKANEALDLLKKK
jgi:hypothetical protein